MKINTILLLGALLAPMYASAAPFEITSKPLGTGQTDEPYYFEPQYLPYYPTAATIWPRVIEVPCERNSDGKVLCEGYNWSPAMGRGEYLFVVPKFKQPETNTPFK